MLLDSVEQQFKQGLKCITYSEPWCLRPWVEDLKAEG